MTQSGHRTEFLPLKLERVFAETEWAAESLGVEFSAGVPGFFPMTRVTETSSRF
jgi:hypothetical protein